MLVIAVSIHEFLDYCEANQNRATVGTYVFFVQTFSLIISQTSDFSVLELFVGLDVGKAAKTCRMPTCGLFCGMMGMGVVPVLAGLSIYFGMWYLATRVGDDVVTATTNEAKKLMDEGELDLAATVLQRLDSTKIKQDFSQHKPQKGLPMRWHHLQRGYMQLYLFTFMPITRRW